MAKVKDQIKKTYDFTKRNVKKIIVIGCISATALGYGLHRWNKGDTIYDGEIDGRRIKYIEDQGTWITGKENIMEYKKNGITYKLIDSKDKKGIEWKSAKNTNPDTCTLERVVADTNKGEFIFDREKEDDETLDGKNSKEILGKGSIVYNYLRRKIKTDLREKHNEEIEKIFETLKSSYKKPQESPEI